jgi:hypothetical protein
MSCTAMHVMLTNSLCCLSLQHATLRTERCTQVTFAGHTHRSAELDRHMSS